MTDGCMDSGRLRAPSSCILHRKKRKPNQQGPIGQASRQSFAPQAFLSLVQISPAPIIGTMVVQWAAPQCRTDERINYHTLSSCNLLHHALENLAAPKHCKDGSRTCPCLMIHVPHVDSLEH